MKHRKFLTILLALSAVLLILGGCGGQEGVPGPVGPAGAPGPMGPVGPAGEDATASQQYVGAQECGRCHEEQFANFQLSGHGNSLTRIANGQAPTFPYDSETGGITEPPLDYTWEDISYVIGGYGWMARFVDQNGFLISGDEDAATQYNLANERLETDAGWVSFHAGEENLSFDCAACHTTGYAPQGHQNNLEGVVGTWEFEGVQCEVCHGPGSRHTQDPRGVRMVLDRSSQACGECHVRGEAAQMVAEEGFEQHNQQFSDLFNSQHFALNCVTCHDPHAGTRFDDPQNNPNGGINQACESCHWAQEFQNHERHFNLECIDCHMPKIALSAVGDVSRFTADIRSHQFSINPDPQAPQFNEEGTAVMPYITLTYACKQCHNGEDFSERDLEELAAAASGYHDRPTATPPPTPTAEVVDEAQATPEATAAP